MTKSGEMVPVPVSWTATGGTITANGEFYSEVPGQYWIKAQSAQQAEVADSVLVVVVGPENPVSSLKITEPRLTLPVGASHRFEVQMRRPDGGVADVPVYWTASIGTIDLNGVYSAPEEPGQAIVIAVAGYGVTDTAVVDITRPAPELTGLALSPAQATVVVGKSFQFVPSAAWSDGGTTVPTLDYSASGGVIDEQGTYTAGDRPGNFVVTAHAGEGDMAATAAVKVVLEPIVGLDVGPRGVSLTPGSGLTFSAAGRLANGSSRATPIVWSALGGSISQSGHFTAGSMSGVFYVVASAPEAEIADSVAVSIVKPIAQLKSLAINPSSVVLPAGGSRQFAVTAGWTDGSNSVPQVNWSATGGTIAANGLYVAGPVPGTFRVVVTAGIGVADTSVVTISPPSLASLEVSPSSATVEKGQSQQFAASGTWSDGSSTVPSVTWTATGGSISGSGLFTAGTAAGTFRVIAANAAAARADTALVTVTSTAPVLQSLTISPVEVSVVSGAVQQFNVAADWSNGGSGTPSVVWSASAGRITTRGRFTAPTTAGTYRVVVKQLSGPIADTAWVTVTPPAPELTAVSLAPSTATIQPGGTKQFSVNGVWTGGGSGAPPIRWTVTGGSITTDGLYTAGPTSGTYRVIATQVGGVLADTSLVTIASAQPVLTGISIVPGTVGLVAGEFQLFLANGVWTNGGSGAPSVTWSATGGTINAEGHYIAGTTGGTFRVIAKQQGGALVDTAVVTITAGSAPAATLTSLTIDPPTVAIQTGVKQQFSATARWSNGSTTVPTLDWKASSGTITAAGLYTAPGTAGSYRVIVSAQNGAIADTSNVVVSAPVVSQLTMTPANVSLKVGTTQQFTTSATWSDGVSRAIAVSYSATGGTVSVGGLYTAGQIAGTFAVIASCSCGKADTSRVTITGTSSVLLASLSLGPNAITLARGGKQQYSVVAYLTDGSLTNPVINWSATGGSISSDGLYSAGSSDGTYRVVATILGGLLADTTTVVVQGTVSSPPPSGANNMYFNSSETGCGTDSNVLLCDDFEDGDWYSIDADKAVASGGLLQTDGWSGTIYANPISPSKAAVCGSVGVGGTNCAGSHGQATGVQGGRNMAEHELSQAVNEVYIRYYTKASAGYLFGAEKVLSFNKTNGGGIYWGNLHFNCGAGSASSVGLLQFQPTASESRGCQDVMRFESNRWYFMEVHLKLSSPGGKDGMLEVWADDCGTAGTACSGSPTLRLRVADWKFNRGSSNELIGSIWWEAWSNPGSTGTRLIDQIKASKVGPIGFMR